MAFLGQDGFQWGIGVVEDRFDPEKLGRVRVRWLGLHNDEKQKILTKDLPWSTVMQPATATSMSGVGHNSAIVEGTWVVGFAKDESLFSWIVMGVLPGNSTKTAYVGGIVPGDKIDDSTFGAVHHAKAWGKSRGFYKEFTENTSGDNLNPRKFYDYEIGFFDPTVDQRNIPHPPSDASYGNPGSGGGHVFTPTVDHADLKPEDPDKGLGRVMNHSDAAGGDHPAVHDLDKEDKALWEFVGKPNVPYARLTHSDALHTMFKTTRRLTGDRRFYPAWTDFGTFRWPDTNTHYEEDADKEPEGIKSDRKFWGDYIDKDKGREGVIFSTGYLEPKYWSEDREYGSTGGTWGPAFPVTRDKPALSMDPANLTGIGTPDTRAGWGRKSGEETGYWAIAGEDYRVPYPRVRWVRKTHLSPTERQTVMELFKAGHYGSGVYNVSDPDEGRQDISWNDVKESDLVVVPTPDTNPLALGGIPISFTDGKVVTTKSSLWADSTTYFSDPKLSKGDPAKPLLQTGDIVQIAGVRGMQEINGRIFRLLSCGDNGTSFSMELGTADGKVWSGPGDCKWKHVKDSLGEFEAGGSAVDNANFSAYLGGGVVIPHNPHWSLCWKADMRERQINIGSPDPETGINAKHWNQPSGDFNATYPFNHVYETESGHIMEYDDTPGAERISQFHRSGTNYEIDHNGTKTEYVKGDNYDIRLHDDYMYVKGKVVHTYDDEVMIRYNDRADISAKWKLQLWSGGDLDIHSKRNINMKSDGDINLQADGHINMHATGVTPAQTDKYRAGSRNAEERSKIKMKAAHLEVEMVGDETKPKEYGVFIQSNQAPIGIKTLLEGDPGDIHIAAAENLELFAWQNVYREAHKQSIWDYAYKDYRVEMETGDHHNVVVKGRWYNTVEEEIDIKSCKEDIRLQSLEKDINLKAKLNILNQAEDENIEFDAAKNIQSKAGIDFRLTAINDIRLEAGNDYMQKSGNASSMRSGDSIWIDATAGDMHIKSSADTYLNAGGVLHHLGASQEIGAGEVVSINGSAIAASSAPDPSIGPVTLPDDADPASKSIKAFIPETMELLSIDLPNPRPAVGTSVDMLALNENNIAVGMGGENIRNLHDDLANMEKGLSAYVTKTLPHTSGDKAYDMDQGEYAWTGEHTHKLEDPWNGYTGEPKKMEPLGKDGPKIYPSVGGPCGIPKPPDRTT